MTTPNDFRQQVPDLRKRIDTMLGRQVSGRDYIDTTGNRSRAQPFRTHEARLMSYAQRRYTSVARMCALLAIVRDTEKLSAAGKKPVKVSATGARWQAFGGNSQDHACHSCPCLLLFNGQSPDRITHNSGLRRHIVVEFADCMLMPASINGIDKLVDESLGADAFVDAAAAVLNTTGADWRDGLSVFDRGMGDIYENAYQILYGPASQPQPRKDAEETVIDVLCAYYEGLQNSRENAVAIENFKLEVRREMAIA